MICSSSLSCLNANQSTLQCEKLWLFCLGLLEFSFSVNAMVLSFIIHHLLECTSFICLLQLLAGSVSWPRMRFVKCKIIHYHSHFPSHGFAIVEHHQVFRFELRSLKTKMGMANLKKKMKTRIEFSWVPDFPLIGQFYWLFLLESCCAD